MIQRLILTLIFLLGIVTIFNAVCSHHQKHSKTHKPLFYRQQWDGLNHGR